MQVFKTRLIGQQAIFAETSGLTPSPSTIGREHLGQEDRTSN